MPSEFFNKREEKIVDLIVQAIEQGSEEQWKQGWYNVDNTPFSYNPYTGTRYRGVNAFALGLENALKGYTTKEYMSANQISQEFGGLVKKGEKASYVSWAKKIAKPTDDDYANAENLGISREEIDGDFAQQLENLKLSEREKEWLDRDGSVYVLRHYPVFNLEQCENINQEKLNEIRAQNGFAENAEFEKLQFIENPFIEAIFENSGIKFVYGGNKAFYNPTNDNIRLPERENFKSVGEFYSTALHELGHATGHSSRLNRNVATDKIAYAKEELRAEIFSILQAYELGVNVDLKNHALYLDAWREILKVDGRQAIASAVKDALKMNDFVKKNWFPKDMQNPYENLKTLLDIKENSAVDAKNDENQKERPKGLVFDGVEMPTSIFDELTAEQKAKIKELKAIEKDYMKFANAFSLQDHLTTSEIAQARADFRANHPFPETLVEAFFETEENPNLPSLEERKLACRCYPNQFFSQIPATEKEVAGNLDKLGLSRKFAKMDSQCFTDKDKIQEMTDKFHQFNISEIYIDYYHRLCADERLRAKYLGVKLEDRVEIKGENIKTWLRKFHTPAYHKPFPNKAAFNKLTEAEQLSLLAQKPDIDKVEERINKLVEKDLARINSPEYQKNLKEWAKGSSPELLNEDGTPKMIDGFYYADNDKGVHPAYRDPKNHTTFIENVDAVTNYVEKRNKNRYIDTLKHHPYVASRKSVLNSGKFDPFVDDIFDDISREEHQSRLEARYEKTKSNTEKCLKAYEEALPLLEKAELDKHLSYTKSYYFNATKEVNATSKESAMSMIYDANLPVTNDYDFRKDLADKWEKELLACLEKENLTLEEWREIPNIHPSERDEKSDDRYEFWHNQPKSAPIKLDYAFAKKVEDDKWETQYQCDKIDKRVKKLKEEYYDAVYNEESCLRELDRLNSLIAEEKGEYDNEKHSKDLEQELNSRPRIWKR